MRVFWEEREVKGCCYDRRDEKNVESRKDSGDETKMTTREEFSPDSSIVVLMLSIEWEACRFREN